MDLQSTSKLLKMNIIPGQSLPKSIIADDTFPIRKDFETINNLDSINNQRECLSDETIEENKNLSQIERENKCWKEQLELLKNRIKNMKQNQESRNRLLFAMQSKEQKKKEIKQFKQEMKQKIERNNIEEAKYQKEKKKNATYMKTCLDFETRASQILKESKSHSLSLKNKNEKQMISTILTENKILIHNLNEIKHCKVKHDLIYSQAKNLKKKAEVQIENQELRLSKMNTIAHENIGIQNQIEILGKVEDQCLDNYRRSILFNKSEKHRRILSNTTQSYIQDCSITYSTEPTLKSIGSLPLCCKTSRIKINKTSLTREYKGHNTKFENNS